MKRILAMAVSVALIAAMAIGGTVAYFTDTDDAVNVFAVGNIDIEQLEQQRKTDEDTTNLEPFEEGKIDLMPSSYYDYLDDTDSDEDGTLDKVEAREDNDYWDVNNPQTGAFDKIVTVKNNGESPAYIRTIFAFENSIAKDAEGKELGGVDSRNLIIKNYNLDPSVGEWAAVPDAENVAITNAKTGKVENYSLYTFTYAAPLAPNAESAPSLMQVAMSGKAKNEDGAAIDGEYVILVATEAVQSENMTGITDSVTGEVEKATAALDAAFEAVTATRHPWANGFASDEYGAHVIIRTEKDLIEFANAVNGGEKFKGQTIQLGADITLTKEWTPIGSKIDGTTFLGTFDGAGHTIYGLSVDNSEDKSGDSSAGFFGWVDGAAVGGEVCTKIKNVNFDGASVKGSHWVGVVAGYMTGEISNCKVTNSYVEGKNVNDDANGDKVGGITGYMNEAGTMVGNTVSNCTIIGNRDIGGIVGAVAGNPSMKNNTVKNTSIYYTTKKDSASAGAIVSGRTEYKPDETNKAEGVFVYYNESVSVGNVDGLSYVETSEGYRSYSVSTAAGLSELNSMMSNKTAGKYAKVNLTADIDFSGKEWTPVDSHADSAFWLSELNGNGHTISNLTVNGQAMFTRFAGFGDVAIKDITFDEATVSSTAINTSILTVQSYQNVLLDNVDVKNSTITGSYKVAPLIATVYNESSSTITATLKNCNVSDTTVKATSYDFCTTGMVAFVNAGDNDKIEFENCTVKDVKLIAPNDSYDAHAYVYTTGSGSLYNEAEGVTVNNCTFEELK